MTTFPSIPLSTSRLTIRLLAEPDRAPLFDIFSHPEVMRYWSSPPWTALAQADKMILSTREGYETGDYLQLGIERTADHALMGTCTLFSINFQCRRAEIGYALGRPYWGQGYMHEALQRWVQYAFEDLNLNRLEADIDPRNLASAKALQRLGFQKEGYMPERWIVGEEVSDTEFYGLLARNWRAG
ncbi:MAG TPA: GNAT family N-acetyltransferase [Anaerolineales bacterium]|nr:GNAT family N-acetyltransferase [Anaerolineales bacterium]